MFTGTPKYCSAKTAALAVLALSTAGGVPTFTSLDRDGDGLVTEEEAAARHGLRELMTEYDRDRDGRLNTREYQRLLEDAIRETRRIDGTDESP